MLNGSQQYRHEDNGAVEITVASVARVYVSPLHTAASGDNVVSLETTLKPRTAFDSQDYSKEITLRAPNSVQVHLRCNASVDEKYELLNVEVRRCEERHLKARTHTLHNGTLLTSVL